MTFLDSAISGLGSAVSSLSGANPITQQQQQSYESNGFLLAATPTADGNGLPYTKIAPGVSAALNRNIMTWFVPQFGTVQMFVNPEKVLYHHKKLVQKTMTKGGFSLQYWGEDLSTLDLSGTTGSSGIEGINMLYEVYRSEQLAFDASGLVLAANNAAASAANSLSGGLMSALGGAIGGGTGGGLINGLLGTSSPANTLSARTIPCLASLAFAVELYYGGWVFRGYFDNMDITESADDFRMHYAIKFIVTQRRGYRTNCFPWQNSPSSGSSQYTTPGSFNGDVGLNQSAGIQTIDTSGGSVGSIISGLL